MKNIIKRIITGISLGLLFWLSLLYLPPLYFSLILLTILSLIIIFEWKNFFDRKHLTFWLLMPLYPILPFALLIHLSHMPEYRHLLLILFILASSHDTGSYIVGNLIGRHRIYPLVSPGKTWEGFFGGFIFACFGLWLVLHEFGVNKSLLFIIIFSLATCTLSLLGDLFESLLKRHAGIKDSGTLLPGHGGFLDRFDGILFTVFFFYFFKSYLTTLLPFTF